MRLGYVYEFNFVFKQQQFGRSGSTRDETFFGRSGQKYSYCVKVVTTLDETVVQSTDSRSSATVERAPVNLQLFDSFAALFCRNVLAWFSDAASCLCLDFHVFLSRMLSLSVHRPA